VDTRHPDEGTLYAYVEGQLPAPGQVSVEGHVAGCAECASLVAEARGLIAAASGIVRALDSVPANVVPPRRVRRLPPWLAAAAVFVLAVGVSTVAVRSGMDSRPEILATSVEVGADMSQRAAVEQPTPAVPVSGGTEPSAAAGEPSVVNRSVASRTSDMSESRRTAAAGPQNALPRKSDPREEAVEFSRASEALVTAPAAAPATTADAQGAGAGAGDPDAGRAALRAPVAARTPTAVPGDAARQAFRQQETTITGRIVAEGGKPLSGANVFINELSVSVATDASGTYALTIPFGQLHGSTAVVRASATGYAPQSQPVTVAAGTQTADFELKRELTQLSELVVAGSTTADVFRSSEAEMQAPIRTIRYEVSRGVIVELREFHAPVRVPLAHPGVNEYRWNNSAGTRGYVLSGPLTVAELERLASRLGELRVIR
jgi:hypothetical protein